MKLVDNNGYAYIAGMHGYPNWCSWHGPQSKDGWPGVRLFLPWHRAHLYTFEKLLQNQIPDITIPWWDWSNIDPNQKIPKAFADEAVDGEPNPLYKFYMSFPEKNIARDTRRFPGSINNLTTPTQSIVNEIINVTNNFDEFSDSLEDLHGLMSVWTGGDVLRDGQRVSGDMASVAFSSFDPIYWPLHSMVDRLWWLWQKKHGINNIPDHYKQMSLDPFNVTVSDVLDVSNLGYDYEDSLSTTDAFLRTISQPKGIISKPSRINIRLNNAVRIDLELYELTYPEALFEIRLFLNNPLASNQTLKDEKMGYITSISMIEDTTKKTDASEYAESTKYKLRSVTRNASLCIPYINIPITDLIKKIGDENKPLTITVIPSMIAETTDSENIRLGCEKMAIVSYSKKSSTVHVLKHAV